MKTGKGKQSALKQLQSVWGRAGLTETPQVDEAKGNIGIRKQSARSPRYGGVQVSLRVTADEKKRFELIAMRESSSLNEIFSRMLALYEREHGRVELTTFEPEKE